MRPGTYRLPTVRLRHKVTGRLMKINATDYARDIARWAVEWKLVGENHGNAPDKVVEFERQQSEIELIRRRNPLSPASGDDRRAFEARSDTVTNIETGSSVDAPGADEAPAVDPAPPAASDEPPKRGRGRPRKDGTPAQPRHPGEADAS